MKEATTTRRRADAAHPLRAPGKRPLRDLPNLGPKSSDMLALAGIDTIEQLREIGAVAAYCRVRRARGTASLNLLWALEGALTGLPWQEVARSHRTSLLLALEAHAKES